MLVGADRAHCRPPIIKLVGKKEGRSRTGLIDLLVGGSGSATEENLVAHRAGTRSPADHPLCTARRLVAPGQSRGRRRSVRQRADHRCIESRDIGDVAEIHVRKIVGRQMLAFVVLESLRESKTRITKTDERAVIASREMRSSRNTGRI